MLPILINAPHFFGTALLGSTRRPIHFALANNLVCSCPTQRQLFVLYPVDVLHRIGTYPGHIRGEFLAAACFSTYIMSGTSNVTTSTIGVMSSCSSVPSSVHRTMSDLVSSLSLPLSDIMVNMVDSP